jgi:hypothetical protein
LPKSKFPNEFQRPRNSSVVFSLGNQNFACECVRHRMVDRALVSARVCVTKARSRNFRKVATAKLLAARERAAPSRAASDQHVCVCTRHSADGVRGASKQKTRCV